MFQRIDHIAFDVKDRIKSIKFYEENFGFEKYFEHDVPVPVIEKIVYLRLGDTILELIHMPEGQKNSGYHFCLTTNDFQGDYHRLKDAGVEVLQEPHNTSPRVSSEEGWKRAVFKGLDGEQIEIRG
ncbi:VOC family protein [Anaerosolibacter sp.]|uniref:VOC family protein n=1 Tax=Anaerosolibacter sp. TaxID=1872527 RepID=UPI0039EF0A50